MNDRFTGSQYFHFEVEYVNGDNKLDKPFLSNWEVRNREESINNCTKMFKLDELWKSWVKNVAQSKFFIKYSFVHYFKWW